MYCRWCPRIVVQLVLVVGVLVGVMIGWCGVMIDVFGVLMSLGSSAGSAHGMPAESIDRGMPLFIEISLSLGGMAGSAHRVLELSLSLGGMAGSAHRVLE